MGKRFKDIKSFSFLVLKYRTFKKSDAGGKNLEFKEFLLTKHTILKGERKLNENSANQYVNRLKSLRDRGLYDEENTLDSQLKTKIQDQYKDCSHYVGTINYYLAYKKYLINRKNELFNSEVKNELY